MLSDCMYGGRNLVGTMMMSCLDRRSWGSHCMYQVGTVMMSCIVQSGGAGVLTVCSW